MKKIFLVGLILASMGLFSFFKKSSDPYKDIGTNLIYNLLFCDDLELYKANHQPPITYPFDVLFSETSSVADLQRIIDDRDADPRVRILAYNRQLSKGHKAEKKELLAVIVEVGLTDGLDVLASFDNGTARYINQTGKMLIWETTTDGEGNRLTKDLFTKSKDIIKQIGPWDQPRRAHPGKGTVRITFLVSDGLYFGEGPIDILFNDALASPALTSATELMKYLTEKSLTSPNR
jgi:hypothetical protein